jgi:hypothetical protein
MTYQLLWEYKGDNASAIKLYRGDDGNYYIHVTNELGIQTATPLPPGRADEMREALRSGFDPQRDDPHELAIENNLAGCGC